MLPSGHLILSSMFIPVTSRCPSFLGQFHHSSPYPHTALSSQKSPLSTLFSDQSLHLLVLGETWLSPEDTEFPATLLSGGQFRSRIMGQKVVQMSFLLLTAPSKPLSLSCSPIGCLEAPVIRLHLPAGLPAVFSPVLRATPRFPVFLSSILLSSFLVISIST